MRSILEQMSTDPTAASVYAACRPLAPLTSSRHLKNPEIAKNIQRLINAGIIQMGSAPQ